MPFIFVEDPIRLYLIVSLLFGLFVLFLKWEDKKKWYLYVSIILMMIVIFMLLSAIRQTIEFVNYMGVA